MVAKAAEYQLESMRAPPRGGKDARNDKGIRAASVPRCLTLGVIDVTPSQAGGLLKSGQKPLSLALVGLEC